MDQKSGSVDVTGLTSDSRKVEPGYLFAALPGGRIDGRAFVADAAQRGAAAVLVPGSGNGTAAPLLSPRGEPVPVLVADNPRRRFAQLAARFYRRQPKVVAAVTGTNGKTSVVWFLRQIWERLGHAAAGLGTLGLTRADRREPGSLTTPDPVALHETLARLAGEGIDHLAMEASSHGLDQHRLDGVRIVAAAFTNLTRDHLDYHLSEQAYLAAKLRLFDELVEAGGTAVVCADARHADTFCATATGRGLRLLTYGRRAADIRLERVEAAADGQRLVVTAAGSRHEVMLPLVGEFQAFNALCAAGLAWATGAEPAAALGVLGHLEPVPGRLERVARLANGAWVFVDYAHTPDALAAALCAVRPLARGRLVLLFGCGGDRDPGKRPEMGRLATALADRIVVTDDNPRSEDPAAIRRQILAACGSAVEIGDRREAIRSAIRDLAAGDVLVVAGKGHETGQIVGHRVLAFDDREVARAAVRELEG